MKMNIWIIGLLILGTAFTLVNSQDDDDDDDDYEVKRFHVQSRQLDGSPTCVETRRKRSTSQSKDMKDTYGSMPSATDDDEKEIAANIDLGSSASTAGILLQDSDLLGNAGVLVIRNQAANTPILFELRPVETDPSDIYYETDDENNPDAADDEYFEDNEDFEENNADSDESEEVDENFNKENRYKPNSDLDNDSEEYEETPVKKRRVQPTKAPKRRPSNGASSSDTNKKRKRPSKAPVKSQRKPNRRKNQSSNKIRKSNKNRKPNKKRKTNKKRNQNRNRKRKPNKNRYGSSDREEDSNVRRKGNGYSSSNSNRHQFNNKHDSSLNKRNKIGTKVNKGSGEKTVSRTMTTTHTGTAAEVNCIIINKEPTPTTQRPFWDILGRSADTEDRSFGLRKRFKNRFQFANA